MTYRNLIRLSSHQRMQYMDGYRKLLIELDEIGTYLMADNDDPSNTGSRFAEYLEQIPGLIVATAEASTCTQEYPIQFVNTPLCGRYLEDLSGSCSSSEIGQAAADRYFCIDREKFKSANGDIFRPIALVPRQNVIANRDDGARGNQEAVQEAREEDKARMRQALRNRANGARQQEMANNTERENLETGKAMRAQAQQTRENEFADAADTVDQEQGKAMRESLRKAREKEYSDAAEAEDQATGKAMRENARRAKEKEISEAREAEEAAMGKAMQARLDRRDAIDKAGGRGTCGTPTLSCDFNAIKAKKARRRARTKYDKDKKAALDKFRKSDAKVCISAGNMSGYSTPKPQPGGCRALTEFCLNPEDCGQSAGATRSARSQHGDSKEKNEDLKGFQTKYSCESGQTICNPLVFGLESKAKAICVKAKGRRITKACDDKARGLEKKNNGYIKDFLDQAPRGVSEAWDDYADNFNATCKQNSGSMDAHCEECGHIAKRLSELRALATNGQCNDAKDYERAGSRTTR